MVSDQIRTKSGEPYRPLADRRLLLVEDEALVAMELEELINHLGGEAVGPFSRAADALDALRREQVNGAVLDVRLNGDTTFQIADILLQAANPIIFVDRRDWFDTGEVLSRAASPKAIRLRKFSRVWPFQLLVTIRSASRLHRTFLG
jgi:CheY-like chemotaxis protein